MSVKTSLPPKPTTPLPFFNRKIELRKKNALKVNNETTKKEPAKDHKKTYTVEC